ncbi:MBL fold metallo-hydrolase [Paraburkholderia sp. CI3]|uniref:MBL fold metallo-hydrolase n=1 Tax=Paraburkholderia sp. CI3 TaxID=2991060 RepID=UPI003D1EC174
MLNKHKVLRSSKMLILVVAGALLGVMTAPAYAAAPMVKTSAPGYYRIMLGDFEVTTISDGTFAAPVAKLMTNTTPAVVNQGLKRAFLSNPINMSINAYLINTGSKLVLIDAGLGAFDRGYGPGAGHLLANLKSCGLSPEQIDEIYVTHFHPDHVGGLVTDGKMTFPNAIVRADRHEAAEWLNEANAKQAPNDFRFGEATAALTPYIQAGHFQPFEGATQLIPGIRSVPAPGHTEGHTVYRVDSNGQTMLICGDIIHPPAVQFDNPSITIAFDNDSKEAIVSRRRIFDEAAERGYLVGTAHISFPGIGHLRKAGKGYVWVPVDYLPMY